jgi:hypothetical protein
MIRTLSDSLPLLYQFRPTYPAKFSDFILSGDAATYGEDREKGSLTKFRKIEECVG